MTNQHPITPPPELVNQWCDEDPGGFEMFDRVATKAARWGADQELEACCEWFQEFYKTESWVKHDLKHFRVARRPKPPSLKEQALALLQPGEPRLFNGPMQDTIRRALEALDD